MLWLSKGVDLVLDNLVNFDRSFLAVRHLLVDRLASDELIVFCLQRIFQILLSCSSSSPPVGLAMALMCDRLVAAVPVACTEVILSSKSELELANLMIAGFFFFFSLTKFLSLSPFFKND